MWRLLKILPALVVAGILLVPTLLSGSLTLAAPAALPNCGNDVVAGSNDSSFPDIAASTDASHTYTALAWSEGTGGKGSIKLAYSQAITSARTWQQNTGASGVVDSTGSNQNPAIAFDTRSAFTKTVHLVYERYLSPSSTDIYYAQCALGGACSAPLKVNPTATRVRGDVDIALNNSGDVVVFYTASSSSNTRWLNYAYKRTTDTSFKAFEGGGFAVATNVFGQDNIGESSVALAASGDTLHVAYSEDSNLDLSNEQIKYWKMNIANGQMNGAAPIASALSAVETRSFPAGFGTVNPDFVSLATLDNKLVLAWQLTSSSVADDFYIGYATYNGTIWDLANQATDGYYRYWKSDTAAKLSALGAPNINDKLGGFTGATDNGLHPDVALHYDGPTQPASLVMHLAWHQESPFSTQRTDIMYSFKKNLSTIGTWADTPILADVIDPNKTNVTDFYGVSEKELNSSVNNKKLRPRMLFGSFGQHHNRLQLVYGSANLPTDTKLKVRYNGWELGNNFLSPVRSEQDSDCDTVVDDVEIPTPGMCNDIIGSDYQTGLGNTSYANCDDNFLPNPPGDYVPDFLDTNSDGDFLTDDVDTTRIEYTNDGGVFLPVVLKS